MSRLRGMVAAIAVGAVGMTLLVPTAAQAVDDKATTSSPKIVRSVSDAGFVHPGIGLTADNLENMRTQVARGVEPWASYYAAMVQTPYAAKDYRGENQGVSDNAPLSDAYDSDTMSTRALHDSKGALTQALQYVVTGDEIYRANALHVIRTWSSLDPAKYAYFTDAHIHTGVPLYQLLVAAEIIRSTVPADNELDGYDLRWSATDQQRIETNLIRPVLTTFLYSQDRMWNQHLYGVIGMIAAAIFMDDKDLYDQRVEWFTVNSTYQPEVDINNGDVNGALASLVRPIAADDPLNTTGTSFIQVMEMGRDQAHTEGDIDLLGAIARIINDQGTRLDPTAGTVSTASDAQTPYEFLDDRILKGADVFAAFMMGDDVPYVDTSGGSGTLSQAYRGRINNSLDEIYLQYKYVAGVNVAKEAPHLEELYDHRDGPLYYSGASVENFWADRGTDFTGAEYWVAFPAQLAHGHTTVPATPSSAELAVGHVGHSTGKGASWHKDKGTPYVRLDSAQGNGQLAVRRAVWPDRSSTALIGLKVRTTDTAVLEVAPTSAPTNDVSIQLPDTGGQWRYVTLDIAANSLPISPVGENIVFLRAAAGSARVDVASVLAQAGGALTPPTFTDGASLSVVAVAGEPFARTLTVTDAGTDNATLELQGAPKGVTLAKNGVLAWQPTAADIGSHQFVVAASDGTTDTALAMTVTVVADRASAIGALLAGLATPETYTSSSWAQVEQARAAAEAGIDDASASEFAALLESVRVAVGHLELLNPKLGDGSLDFHAIVTSPQISAPTLALLTDGDNQTSWGDLRVPSVVFDFGPGFRVRADSFGFLARDTFDNRAQGTNVYGSDDGVNWTLLTEHTNAGDDTAIETVPVIAGERQDRFRFLKFQVDEPGVPTDPAYPGIWTLADVRINGERSEAVGSLDAVTIASQGSVAGRVVPGDPIELRVSADPGISNVTATILGSPAQVSSVGSGSWLATLTVPDPAPIGVPVTFSIGFITPDGRKADPVQATTDGSKLYVSTDAGLLDNAFAAATTIDPTGQTSSAGAKDSAAVFDGDPTTYSDTRAVNGVYAITWDFGAGAAVSLTGADLLVRQDGYGTSRIADMRLEGSNDLTNWTRLTPAVPQGTLDWQRWPVTDQGSYRYVRLVNGNIIGVAELRLFGKQLAAGSPAS